MCVREHPCAYAHREERVRVRIHARSHREERVRVWIRRRSERRREESEAVRHVRFWCVKQCAVCKFRRMRSPQNVFSIDLVSGALCVRRARQIQTDTRRTDVVQAQTSTTTQIKTHTQTRHRRRHRHRHRHRHVDINTHQGGKAESGKQV